MKKAIQDHLEVYGKSYLILLICIIIGVTIGVLSLNNSNENTKKQIITYLTDEIGNIDKNNISYLTLLKNSIFNKTKFLILLIFLSLSIIGKYAIIVAITFKGFQIGYSISGLILAYGVGKGIAFSLSMILLSELIYIPTIFYVVIISIQMFNDWYYQNYDKKSKFVLKYILKLIYAFIIVIFISLIETFLNVNIFLLFGKIFATIHS